MNNYILSIDPSIKESGFILWEIKRYPISKGIENINPIWANTYNFKKFDNNYEFKKNIFQMWNKDNLFNYEPQLYLFIERGFHMQNRNTTEMLDCLRGNIFGLFNKLYEPKKHGISPKEWQNWILTRLEFEYDFKLINDQDKTNVKLILAKKKKDKQDWIFIANLYIKYMNWTINIKDNHNLADALLIGWYAINNRLEKE